MDRPEMQEQIGVQYSEAVEELRHWRGPDRSAEAVSEAIEDCLESMRDLLVAIDESQKLEAYQKALWTFAMENDPSTERLPRELATEAGERAKEMRARSEELTEAHAETLTKLRMLWAAEEWLSQQRT